MAGNLVCCLFCGRDTQSKTGVCSRCAGRKSFGIPASHSAAISNKTAPDVCDVCGREFRGEKRVCDECLNVGAERSYHGDNYGDDE